MKEEEKNKKIKVYADRLQKDLMNRRWMMVTNITLYVFFLVTIVFLSTRGEVILVGENLIAEGRGDLSFSDPEIVRIRADGHARLFYDRFFTFDYNNFEKQKNKAIYLGDQSIEEVYTFLKKQGFYADIITHHYIVKSVLDSSKIALQDNNNVEVYCYGKMSLTNNAYLENRELNITLSLVPIAPLKELNPYGFSIAQMDLNSNKIIETRTVQP